MFDQLASTSQLYEDNEADTQTTRYVATYCLLKFEKDAASSKMEKKASDGKTIQRSGTRNSKEVARSDGYRKHICFDERC